MNTLSPSARPSIRHTKPMTEDEAFEVIAQVIDELRRPHRLQDGRLTLADQLEEAYDVLEAHIDDLRDGIEYMWLVPGRRPMNTLSPSARPSIHHTKLMTKDEAFDVIATIIGELRGPILRNSLMADQLEEAYDVLEAYIDDLREISEVIVEQIGVAFGQGEQSTGIVCRDFKAG